MGSEQTLEAPEGVPGKGKMCSPVNISSRRNPQKDSRLAIMDHSQRFCRSTLNATVSVVVTASFGKNIAVQPPRDTSSQREPSRLRRSSPGLEETERATPSGHQKAPTLSVRVILSFTQSADRLFELFRSGRGSGVSISAATERGPPRRATLHCASLRRVPPSRRLAGARPPQPFRHSKPDAMPVRCERLDRKRVGCATRPARVSFDAGVGNANRRS